MRVIGLMSGTSLDGIDACLLRIEEGTGGADAAPRGVFLEGFLTRPWSPGEQRRIGEGIRSGSPSSLSRLHAWLGEGFADAVQSLLLETGRGAHEVAVIGSHGQTLRHSPPSDGGGWRFRDGDPSRGDTLQLGCPATIALRTGIPVVHDFRAADLALGGEGAPLVPWADVHLFSRPARARMIQNLGGMGNLTWLPPAGAGEPPVAFDTGPGVALLDEAARRATGGRLPFDEGGRLGSAGSVDEGLLAELLADRFFLLPPPRSTGRERFGAERVEALARRRGLIEGAEETGWPDLLATLAHFTARSIGDALTRWIRPRPVDEVVLAGGGARNPALVRAIRGVLAPLEVRTGAEALGFDPDAREAAAFALLAWAHLRGIPANIPSVTGASGPALLGSFTPAPGRVR